MRSAPSLVVGGIAWRCSRSNDFWLLVVTKAVILGVIFLSITVITGMAGQISLCQATFAAVGGFATAQLVDEWDLPVLLTMLVGAVARRRGRRAARDPRAPPRRHLPRARDLRVRADVRQHAHAARLGQRRADAARRAAPGAVLAATGRSSCSAWPCSRSWGRSWCSSGAGTTGKFLDALRGSETGASAIGISPARQPGRRVRPLGRHRRHRRRAARDAREPGELRGQLLAVLRARLAGGRRDGRAPARWRAPWSPAWRSRCSPSS